MVLSADVSNTYLQSSEGVGLFFSAVDLFSENGPLGLLIELGDTEIIHLSVGGRGGGGGGEGVRE